MSENIAPILVAPRPVRIASAPGASFAIRSHTPFRLVSAVADHLERMKIGATSESDEQGHTLLFDSSTSDKDLGSPRSSSRFQSEALEEFLSILRPSFFPPSSPILRARRNGASLPCYPYHFKARSIHSRGSLVEEVDRIRSNAPTRSPEYTIDREYMTSGELERIDSDVRWYTANTLSSPISRGNTRNPFQRHQTYESAGRIQLGISSPSPLSPASVPLPSPTPEELI